MRRYEHIGRELHRLIGIFKLNHFPDLSNAKTTFVLIKKLKNTPNYTVIM